MPNLTFTAKGDTIWQGSEYVGTSPYAAHLVELLNLGQLRIVKGTGKYKP